MKRVILFSLSTAIITMSCISYPRYGNRSATTPEQAQQKAEFMSTDDFLRFGLILQEQLGRPYKGTSRYDPGLDCSMFTRGVFMDFNRTILPRTASEQFKEGKEVPKDRLRYGDLVFFRTERDRISHVGIFIGSREFIHASTSNGVIISSLNEKYWAKRYAGARRILK